MKNSVLSILLISFFLISTFYFVSLYFSKSNENIEKVNFRKQIGVYVIDLDKTNLGDYYERIDIYRYLKISFKDDSTFSMNMKVPFLLDSVGVWNAAGGGLEDWNWIYYKNWDYLKFKKNTGDQFSFDSEENSIFYINSPTPEKGQLGLDKIYFKRL